MDAKSTTCSSKGTLPSGEELPNEISEVLPKAGLVYSEKGSLGDILCKPKILPLKSITLEVLESLSESQSGDVKRAASEEGEQNQRQGLGVLRAEREVGVASVGTTTEATSRESGQQGAGEEGQHKRQQGGRGQRTEREVVGVGVGVSRAAAATIQTQAISRESRPADSSFPPPSAAEAVSGEPLPRIDDLLDRVQGCRYFSKIDLKFGYHQIAIRPEDQHKTAFQTRYGLYEFVVMPFGLCNAPGTIQHDMNRIFHDYLDKFVVVYLDDILIFSKTVEEHVAHLDKVLSLLRQHKVNMNGEKCEFGRTRILYLGHEISAEGLKPDDAKVASIRDWPRPQSVTEMRSFLGMTGYCRTFVKNYSIVAAPLTDLTRLDTPWEWTDECAAAFRHLKHALMHYEVLKLPDPDKPFTVTTDASQYGIGALLALTDNVTQSLVEAYREDQFMSEIIRRLEAKDKKTSAEFELVNGLLFLEKAGNKRLCVPNSESLHSLFLGECHDATGHFGYKKTAANLLQRFWWPTMMRDAQLYVETCQVCQRDKPRTQAPLGLLNPLPIPERPGESLSMDFMDKLVTSKSGMRQIFVIVDRFSKYARLIAMSEIAKTEYVIRLFKENWVRDFGLPKSIVSDRDVRFTSELWKAAAAEQGTQLQMTSGNHPEGNGRAEQMNRAVHHLLRHYIKPNQVDWDEKLALQNKSDLILLRPLINYRRIKGLLDCGATRNFMSPSAVQKLHLGMKVVQLQQPLQVRIGDSTVLTIREKVRGINVTFDNAGEVRHSLNFYMFPDRPFDLVFSMQWLRAVNPRIDWQIPKVELPNSKGVYQPCMIAADHHPQTSCFCLRARELYALSRQYDHERLFIALVKQTDAPSIPCPPEIQQVVDQYGDLIQEPFGLPNRPTKHQIELLPGAVPPKGRMYKMSPAELEELKRQLETLTSKGWIRPNTSEFGAPVLFVPKGSGEFRMCIDYRGLNKITRKSTEPLPRIDDLLDMVQGCTIFSKVDLKSDYHQIEMAEEDVHKTAFKTRYGTYEYLVMSFGLCNAPGIFQTEMHRIFRPYLDKFMVVYLDDILVFSRTVREHAEHLALIVQALRDSQYKINREKSSFRFPSVIYLGHVISGDGLAPEAAKIAAIQDWPQPQTVLLQLLRPVISPDQQDWDLHLARAQLMYNMFVRSSTGFSPYRLHWGREPRQPLDDIIDKAKPDLTPGTAEFARRDRLDVERVRANLFKAQKAMIEQANRHRRPSPIRIGDYVWVTSSELSREKDISPKLLPRYLGPWQVLDKVGADPFGPSHVIDVPLHLRTYPVFHASNLLPFTPADAFPYRPPQWDPPIPGKGYDVVAIQDEWGTGPDRQYLVRFAFQPPFENRWFYRRDLVKTAKVDMATGTLKA
ncbi:hypothetical protein CBR_g44399 [Chara braunii]|uniref:Reverse transcriptase n=1 Tax=Chara braunii TaxID=69332 RepID=A0A388LXA3_CHABU|nr:hypothetical protein CBR_g44399 [Chara braunii]|eukprot:GBG86946.1 hypothetical protein CBR_g44399 [Chara braunii]